MCNLCREGHSTPVLSADRIQALLPDSQNIAIDDDSAFVRIKIEHFDKFATGDELSACQRINRDKLIDV